VPKSAHGSNLRADCYQPTFSAKNSWLTPNDAEGSSEVGHALSDLFLSMCRKSRRPNVQQPGCYKVEGGGWKCDPGCRPTTMWCVCVRYFLFHMFFRLAEKLSLHQSTSPPSPILFPQSKKFLTFISVARTILFLASAAGYRFLVHHSHLSFIPFVRPHRETPRHCWFTC
jgi:hypothetical protein